MYYWEQDVKLTGKARDVRAAAAKEAEVYTEHF